MSSALLGRAIVIAETESTTHGARTDMNPMKRAITGASAELDGNLHQANDAMFNFGDEPPLVFKEDMGVGHDLEEMIDTELLPPPSEPEYKVVCSYAEHLLDPGNPRILKEYKYKEWVEEDKERQGEEKTRIFTSRCSAERLKEIRQEMVGKLNGELQTLQKEVDWIKENNEIMVCKGQDVDATLSDLRLKKVKLMEAEAAILAERNRFIDRVEEYERQEQEKAEALQLAALTAKQAAEGEDVEELDAANSEMIASQMEMLTTEIDETKCEMMMLPSNLRGPFEKLITELEIKRLKIELLQVGENDPAKAQEIRAKVAEFEMKELVHRMKHMDVFEKLDAEGELEQLRNIIDPDYYDNLAEQDEKSQSVKVNYDDPEGRHWETYIRVPLEYTFDQLTHDVMQYFNLDMNDEMGLSDDPLGKRMFCVKDGCVLSETTATNGHFNEGRELWLHMIVDIPDEEQQDWTGPERPMLPPPVVETKSQRANRIRNKRIRMAQTKQFVWYCGFVLSYLVVILTWINVGNAWTMRQAVETAVIEEDFSTDVSFYQKGFHDIATGEEMYDYLTDIFVETIGLEDGGRITDYTDIIGPIRFRQQRLKTNLTYDNCHMPSNYTGWAENLTLGCHPAYDDSLRSKDPFGEPTEGRPEGRFQYSSGGITGMSTSGKLASYKAGGFIVDLVIVPLNFTSGVAELSSAEYVDLNTRVVFVEFLCYNPNLGTFLLVKILFEFSAGGVVTPSVQMMPFETGNPIPWYVWLFQASFLLYILYFCKVWITELFETRQDLGSYLPFFKDGWNVIDMMLLLASLAFYVMLIIYGSLDARRNFKITAYWYQDMNTVADFSQMIADINAMNFLLAALKTFKYLVMSDQFKMFSNTIVGSMPDVMTFMVMFVVIVLSFALSGQLLFGTSIREFSTLGKSCNQLFLISLGDFDYQELKDVTPLFAPLWFISFQVVVFMVMLNIFIGIINFAFSKEHAKAKDTLEHEVRSLLSRIGKGIRNLYWTKPDPNAGPVRPIFDPVSDEVLHPMDAIDEKLFPRPAFRAIPRDSVVVTAALNKPQYHVDRKQM